MSKEEIHDLLAYNGVKIIQRKDLFRFSLDSLLLADFIKINPKTNRIIDLGTGGAPIPLYLSLKTDKPIIGIDIQDDVLALAKKSVELNKLEKQIEIKKLDISNVHEEFESSSFDIVSSNPPFFKFHNKEFLNKLDSQTLSRHEVTIDLEGIITATKKIISVGGSFFMIHRAGRLDEIILLLNKHRFVIKRMKFVYTTQNKTAMMVLLETRYNGNSGDIIIEKPLFIYDKESNYTEEVLKIFHLGDKNYEAKSQLSE